MEPSEKFTVQRVTSEPFGIVYTDAEGAGWEITSRSTRPKKHKILKVPSFPNCVEEALSACKGDTAGYSSIFGISPGDFVVVSIWSHMCYAIARGVKPGLKTMEVVYLCSVPGEIIPGDIAVTKDTMDLVNIIGSH